MASAAGRAWGLGDVRIGGDPGWPAGRHVGVGDRRALAPAGLVRLCGYWGRR